MKNHTTSTLLFIFGIVLCQISANAADNHAKSPPKANADNFRCEKMADVGLANFKEKLLATCDLDRPYTMAATDNLSNHSYIYCYHMQSGQ